VSRKNNSEVLFGNCLYRKVTIIYDMKAQCGEAGDRDSEMGESSGVNYSILTVITEITVTDTSSGANHGNEVPVTYAGGAFVWAYNDGTLSSANHRYMLTPSKCLSSDE
jgi:hypothetical protein